MKYSIKAHLRTDKANKETGKCPVNLVVILQSRPQKFWVSDQQIHPKFWDKKSGLVNLSELPRNSEYKKLKADYEALNDFIQHQTSEFRRFMLEQGRLGTIITADKVRVFFKSGKAKGFFEFWDEQVDLMKPKLKASTIFSYENTKKILKLFRPNLAFGDINLDFIRRFDNYLTTDRNNSIGGKYNRHKNLKAIIKEALRSKLIDENPYQYFKVEPAKGNRRYLTFDEVIKLKSLILPQEHQKLKDVKNIFLFSCLTGLRFSDIQNLRWKDVSFDDNRIEIKMMKTSNNLKMTLIPDALEILEQLRGFKHPETFVFKRITNQAINRSIKVIVDLMGIHKLITFHCARHTFATVHLEIGTSIYQVKDLLGHQSIEHTQIYAKNLQKEVDLSMNRFGQMLLTKVESNLERGAVVNL